MNFRDSNLTTKILLAILILLLLLLQYHLWFGEGSIPHILELKKQLAVQLAANKELEQRNEVLIAEIQDLKSGQQAVEERARDELGMIKKGETFYQVVK